MTKEEALTVAKFKLPSGGTYTILRPAPEPDRPTPIRIRSRGVDPDYIRSRQSHDNKRNYHRDV